MLVFETILALLLGATVLSVLARRVKVPYPTLLALGGALVALIPGGPHLTMPPDLILALFVAPVLLDAAYDASLRDLRRNWLSILSLVLVAVGLTTAAIAVAARLLIPELPWGAAVALGALAAPPDAVAALAVLRQVNPPHRMRMILEGESLLNDATALLIYRLAVASVAAGGFSLTSAAPTFLLVVLGSVVVGWLLAWPTAWITRQVTDAPSSVIVQFVTTFGVWLLAERLHLSGVVTIVVYGLTVARRGTPMPARLRVPSFAIWETATVVLNVLAFTLIGLQIRPILESLTAAERARYVVAALAILGVAVVVRIVWVGVHHGLVLAAGRLLGWRPTGKGGPPANLAGAFVVSWSGMRGIVTLAAAIALPRDFPFRDFIQLTAFVVVLGTLVLQGGTLGPLVAILKLPPDDTVETEVAHARKAALKAALTVLDGDTSPAAEALRAEYAAALSSARRGEDPRERAHNGLRLQMVEASRDAIADLRHKGAIGDTAYRLAEEELDWLELSSDAETAPE